MMKSINHTENLQIKLHKSNDAPGNHSKGLKDKTTCKSREQRFIVSLMMRAMGIQLRQSLLKLQHELDFVTQMTQIYEKLDKKYPVLKNLIRRFQRLDSQEILKDLTFSVICYLSKVLTRCVYLFFASATAYTMI